RWPAHDGETQIHDDDIWLTRHRKAQRMLPVDRTDRLVAGLAKGEFEELTDRIVILNDQDPEHRHDGRLRSIISQIWTPWRHSDDRSRAHLLAARRSGLRDPIRATRGCPLSRTRRGRFAAVIKDAFGSPRAKAACIFPRAATPPN